MNDDPTKKLPDDETRYDTQPTITAVLHRLNEIGDNLRAEMGTLRDDLRAEMGTLRDDLKAEIETLRVGQEQLRVELGAEIQSLDRKSTRLNSSHVSISYAVF